MRAELYRPSPAEDEPEIVVAVATWADGAATLDVRDPSFAGLDALLRPTAVAVDDASLRSQGTYGDVLLHPGDLEWFLAAVRTRGAALGLSVRIVADGGPGGWDPAATYRTFDEQVEKLARERG